VLPVGERGRGEQAARGERVRGPYALVGSVLEHERGRDGRSGRATEEPHDGD